MGTSLVGFAWLTTSLDDMEDAALKMLKKLILFWKQFFKISYLKNGDLHVITMY